MFVIYPLGIEKTRRRRCFACVRTDIQEVCWVPWRGLLLLPPATARGSRNLIKLLNPVPAETAHALHSSAWKTELVGLMALISWPAHTGFSFRSFLFCLETSAVHGSISRNFIIHKKRILYSFIKNALKQKTPTFAASDVLLLLPSVHV